MSGALALVLLWPTAAGAQTSAAPSAVAWSSSAYVRSVLEASPEVLAARETALRSGHELKSQYAKAFFPTLSFTGTLEPAKLDANARFSFASWRLNANDLTLSPGLSWNLFNSFTDSLAVKSTRLARDASEEELRARVQDRALAGLRAYYGLLLRASLVSVNEANRRAQAEQYELTQDRYRHGMKSLSDLLKTETDWRTSELNVEGADAERRLALFRFNQLIDLPEDRPAAFPETLALGTTAPPDLNAGLRQALLERPELRRNRLELERADAALKLARIRAGPTLALDFDLANRQPLAYGLTAPAWGANSAVYGFALKLALPSSFNLYSQVHDYRAARAVWRISRHDHESLRRRVREEVYDAHIGLSRALRSYEIALRKEEISKQNLEIVYAEYSQGSADVIRVSQAQLDFVNAQTERMRAFHDANIDYAEYRRAIGVPLWP